DPPVKAALVVLKGVWPRSLPFAELAERTRALLAQANAPQASGPESGSPFLAEVLLHLYSAGLVEFHLEEPPFTLEPGERPVSSPLVRLQIREGEPVLTNLRHSGVTIHEPLARRMVLLLDGTRDRAALLVELAAAAVAERVPITADGKPLADAGQARVVLAPLLQPNLVE